ncbi:Kelch-like ECH-associated protein 1 like protein [Argiope bruennichi]|uniref:Kelch-like ECH-associated protein 1 like protein n=1 Tax=Argiope bruennichi TaxID=94029 RepID=A0A8T0EPS6_ARGBR|nr:Kelch-like ECH-associated protein 1 like protein [Argiope bruennichi]
MKEFIFTWRIENISYSSCKTGKQIVSPVFCASAIKNSVWTLRLYPRGIDNSDYLSLFLSRENDSVPEDLAVNFELSCVSSDGSLLHSCLIPETFKTFAKSGDTGFGELCFMSRHDIFGRRKSLYLPKDTLTLRCRIWKNEEGVDEFGEILGCTRLKVERICLVEAIKLEKSVLKTFPIHSKFQNKVLMSIHVLFYEHSVDIETNLLNVEHMKVTTLKLFLVDNRKERKLCEQISCWCIPSGSLTDGPSISKDLWNMYVGQILCDVKLKTQRTVFHAHKIVLCGRSPVFLAMLTDMEWDSVIQLYYAADKYQVKQLKFLCCSYFLRNVDVKNVCDLLILADRHHDCDLKRKVDDFIWKNDELVFRSSTWKKFAFEQQQLAMKTMLSKYEEKENQNPSETYDDRISRYSEISDDLRYLYQGRIVSDIVIKTPCTLFPAHKSVLCASSCVFKEMLTNDLRDESINLFEITNLEDDIVSRMLFFLYTDSLENIRWDNAMKLYHAAHVYQIQRLIFKCSCFLLEKLTITNASDLLLLSHEHGDVTLKSVVEEYICLHDEEIFGSKEWIKFSRTNLLLANEIMCANYIKADIFYCH